MFRVLGFRVLGFRVWTPKIGRIIPIRPSGHYSTYDCVWTVQGLALREGIRGAGFQSGATGSIRSFGGLGFRV